MTAREVAEPQAAHECGDDDRDGKDVSAAEQGQHPLPDRLVDERGDAACHEHEDEDDAGQSSAIL